MASNVAPIIVAMAFVFGGATASAQEVQTRNTSQYLGDTKWSWTVYIVADTGTLKNIDCVVYHLHPTFVDATPSVCNLGDTKTPFSLTRIGWGTFPIAIDVRFKDGSEEHLTHNLTFVERTVETHIRLRNAAKQAEGSRWRWTAFLKGPPDDLQRVKCAEYYLDPTFENPIRDVCAEGDSSYPFGLTETSYISFDLSARIIFNDGTTQLVYWKLKLPNDDKQTGR